MHSAIPKLANVYGDTVSRNCPTCGGVRLWMWHVAGWTGAYVESFTLILEEHVCCSSLAIACSAPGASHHLHSATTPRAAVAPPVPYVRDMVGRWVLVAEMDGKGGGTGALL
jgi:hypothetical protein